MIAFLKGTIISIKPTKLTINVHNVGYEVHIPLSTYERIKENTEIQLYIHTVAKENEITLYGFYTEEEKLMFSFLISIPGIGPSIALSLLSSMSPSQIITAVKNNSPETLTSIPGIGQSKAEKIIFELKRKLKKFETIFHANTSKESFIQDAIDALISLGFDEKHSRSIINTIINEQTDIDNLEKIIRLALQKITK